MTLSHNFSTIDIVLILLSLMSVLDSQWMLW